MFGYCTICERFVPSTRHMETYINQLANIQNSMISNWRGHICVGTSVSQQQKSTRTPKAVDEWIYGCCGCGCRRG
jgi:hypothetical protein